MATRTWPKTRDGVGSNSGKGNWHSFCHAFTLAWLQQRYIRSILWVGLLLDVWRYMHEFTLGERVDQILKLSGSLKKPALVRAAYVEVRTTSAMRGAAGCEYVRLRERPPTTTHLREYEDHARLKMMGGDEHGSLLVHVCAHGRLHWLPPSFLKGAHDLLRRDCQYSHDCTFSSLLSPSESVHDSV